MPRRLVQAIALSCWLLVLPRLAGGQCVDYPDYLHHVCYVETWGAVDLEVHDDLAYVAESQDRFTVLDVADPAAPTILASRLIAGSAMEATVDDGLAYVAGGYHGGLTIIDVANLPALPILAQLPLPGTAWGVTVDGPRAYVCDGVWGGFTVVDVSVPTAPAVLGSLDTPGHCYRSVVLGDVAYVADGYGLLAVDVSDPAQPQILSSRPTPGSARGIATDGSLLFVADSAVMMVVEPRPGGVLVELASLELPGMPYDLCVDGDLVYLGCEVQGGLAVVDVSDPLQPRFLGHHPCQGNPRGVDASGGHVFVADVNPGVAVFTAAAAGVAAPIGMLDPGASPTAVAVRGDHGYLGTAMPALAVVSLADPATPTLLGSADLPSSPRRLALGVDHAYVAAGAGGLQVVDISDPLAPAVVAAAALPGHLQDLSLDQARLTVLGDFGLLTVVDVSEPLAPQVRGSVALDGLGYGVDTRGDLAVAALYHRGVAAVDLSDPAQPAVLDSITTLEDLALDVAIFGDHAFVAGAYASMTVVDLHDPSQLAVVATYEAAGDAYAIEVVDGIAYLASSWAGVEVVDVSDPTAPYQLGLLPTPSRADDVAVGGELVLAADRDEGLVVGWAQCLDLTGAPAPQPPGVALMAHPNPFNPSTTISFALRRSQPVELVAYDLRGRLVRRLLQGTMTEGMHTVSWDGRDGEGRGLASGVYLARLVTVTGTATARLVLVR